MFTMRRSARRFAKLANAGFDELLALLRHVIFGVLAQVAERSGFF